MSVEDLWLSIRAGNCLRGAGIKTVSELVMKTQEELLGIRNFGRKCLYEVKEAIKGYHD
jgi:DNA-directed RNA polymerase subunit alpha